ncbi:hypothetical protein [Immundisolibacter sp.]
MEDLEINKQIKQETKVKPEIAGNKNLYKVTVAYDYDYEKRFNFLVVATKVERAIDLAIRTFYEYDYGNCIFKDIEFIASEGQYSKPEILLIAE